MKKLYIILIAALLLTLAACLTACSAKPVSLRGTEAPNLPGPTNDALKVTDEGQDWNITLKLQLVLAPLLKICVDALGGSGGGGQRVP